MFKFRKIYIILSIFVLLILGAVTVSHAEELARADMSKIEFEWTGYEKNIHGTLHLKVKNVTLLEDNDYYVHVSHNKNEELTVTNFESLDTENVWNKQIWDDDYTIDGLQDIVETKGDIYVWICELDSDNTPQIVVSAKKIERLEQLPVGKRFSASFADDDTYIQCWEFDTERKVNVKIGVVSDKSILEAIKNKQNDGYQRLLEYSKSAKSIYNGTLPQSTSKSVINSLNIVDGEFYYAYFELENKDGKYYPVEDVALYQGYVYGKSKDLIEEIRWDKLDKKEQSKTPVSGEKEKDNTTATNNFPYTGVPCIIISSIALIISTSIIAIKLKKYKGV